jgi:hypothetical protein
MAARKGSGKPKEAAPPQQIAALEHAVAGTADLARGYLVRGEERWFREAAVVCLVDAATRRDLEVVRHDGTDPELDLAAFLGDLTAAPMFAASRLVLVRSLPQLLKQEVDADAERIVARIVGFLRDRAVPGTLVLEGDTVRADSVVAKAVTAAGGTTLSLRRLWESPPPWNPDPIQAEIVQWLLARARVRKLRLSPEDAVWVAAATGNDLGALEGALDDLGRGGTGTVRERISWTGPVSPFELAESLLRGDAAASLAGIEGLFRTGMRQKDGSREVKPEATINVLFSSLRSKLRDTLLVARAEESGERPGREVLKGPPRGVEETLERAPLRPAGTWARMFDDLGEIERRTRTSRAVDANDLARLALSWKRETVRIQRRPAPRARR